MKTRAFRMQLKAGFEEEYRRRHDLIWPELADALRDAGVFDYSIFLDEQTLSLFAVLKLRDGDTSADLPEHPVVQRWWASMAPLMETEPGNRPCEWPLTQVFHLA